MGDEIGLAVDAGRSMIWTAVRLGAPLLLAGLAVGGVMAFFQALTQVSEASLTFVPKLLGTLGALVVLLPWMISVLCEYTQEMISSMSVWFP